MHYYQFNIADYRKDTVHLTPMEHYIYRTLLDMYYLDEQPIKNDIPMVIRKLGITNDCSTLVQQVFNDFFVLFNEEWNHKRVSSEIDAYHKQLDTASKAGKASAASRKAKKDAIPERMNNDRSTTVQPTNNHKPITINQEPNKKTLARGSRLPPDWKLPMDWGNWALQEKQGCTAEDIRKCAERFKDYWISVAGAKGVKADWQATWRTWVRRDNEIGIRPRKATSRISEAERILGSSMPVLEVKYVTEND